MLHAKRLENGSILVDNRGSDFIVTDVHTVPGGPAVPRLAPGESLTLPPVVNMEVKTVHYTDGAGLLSATLAEDARLL